MKRVVSAALFVSLLVVAVAAGNAHFVGAPTLTITGDTVTVAGKVAGLGNIPQIHVVVTGDASCINGGGHNPRAVNKSSFGAAGDFPVQNGRALFALSMEAVFQPECAPPMTVAWENIVITVTADDGTELVYP
jgi:hypothetical protein